MHLMNWMNERGHMTPIISPNTPWPTFTGKTMPGDCINTSILYTVRERPLLIAKGVKKILSPSWITNTTYECKPGLTVLNIYVSTKPKNKSSIGIVSWLSASLISCKWLAKTVLRNFWGFWWFISTKTVELSTQLSSWSNNVLAL